MENEKDTDVHAFAMERDSDLLRPKNERESIGANEWARGATQSLKVINTVRKFLPGYNKFDSSVHFF